MIERFLLKKIKSVLTVKKYVYVVAHNEKHFSTYYNIKKYKSSSKSKKNFFQKKFHHILPNKKYLCSFE